MSRGEITSLYGVEGGGGLLTDGQCYADSNCNRNCNETCVENDGGKSFNAGGKGAPFRGLNKNARCAGGFGGGGNCGGGGGYSGGDSQVDGKSKNLDLHAGGGGSFVPNADWTEVSI